MDYKSLLDAIEARDMFGVFANAFRQRDWNVVGQGWAGTRAKLDVELSKSDSTQAFFADLKQVYLDNLLYAQKAVSVWAVGPELARDLIRALPGLVDHDSPYRKTFPLPLPEGELSKGLRQAVPTEVLEADGRAVLVFGSKRTSTKEVQIPADEVPQELAAAGYTELVAKIQTVRAAFDCIAVDPEGFVEMRIDHVRHASERELLQYRETLRNRFNDVVRPVLGVFPLLDQQPTNLFPALTSLYRGSGWVIQRLGHVNEGGYINANRGRFRTSDVREDDYHKAGEGAVDSLQVWSITAVFGSPAGHGRPVLELDGHSKLLSSPQPHLDLARFLDCACPEDYFLLLDTLRKCMAQPIAPDSAANDESNRSALSETT